jgi:hypothetical protein
VVDDALANYPQTTHSLASSLNMVHLDVLADEVGEGSSDWDPLYASLDDFTASRLFQDLGYGYMHVGSWWGPTAIDPSADRNYTFDIVREFPETFARTTIVPPILERLPLGFDDPFERQYDRTLFQFASLEEIARDPGLTFTFAHLTMPHPPYVFNADGSYREQGGTAPIEQQYLDQLVATNDRIEALVDVLLAGPDDQDPIVVLQSDEGPYPPELDTGLDASFTWSTESDVELGRRLRILEALYLPGEHPEPVPPLLTPVNTFRLIIDRYFGGDLPMLEDRVSIFDDREHPFRFTDVTGRVRA